MIILTAFDKSGLGMLVSGRPRRFTRLLAAEQDAVLKEWEESWRLTRRTVFQALCDARSWRAFTLRPVRGRPTASRSRSFRVARSGAGSLSTG